MMLAAQDFLLWCHVLSVALWSLMAALDDWVSHQLHLPKAREMLKHHAAVREYSALLLTPNLGWRAEGRGDAPLAHAVITAAASFLFPQFIFGLHLPLLTLDFHLLYCKTGGKYIDLYSQ